jgi:dGTPase
MNLSAGTLAAITKYPWRRYEHPKIKSYLNQKWGTYDDGAELMAKALELVKADGIFDGERSIEAAIMDLADDIAYSVGDNEDFYRAGIIDFSALRVSEEEFKLERDELCGSTHPRRDSGVPRREFYGYAARRLRDSFNRKGVPFDDEIFAKAYRWLQPSLPEVVWNGGNKTRSQLHAFASRRIEDMSAECVIRCRRMPDGNDYPYLFIPSHVEMGIEILKKLTWFFVIDRPRLHILQKAQCQALRRVFFFLYDVTLNYFAKDIGSHFQIPTNLVEYCLSGLNDWERSNDKIRQLTRSILARAVVDFICTLTDNQVMRMAAQIEHGGEKGDIDLVAAY